jgi:hypothetical protein
MNRSVLGCALWLLVASACVVTSPRATSDAEHVVAPDGAGPHGPVFDRASMELDMDLWLSEMEAAHPDPYTRIDREAFHSRVRDARARLPASLDPLEYFAVLQRLASALRDAHTRFHLPESSAAFSKDWFPLRLRVHDERVFVAQARADITRGCEIARINGVPAARILDIARGLISAEIDADADVVASLFVPVLWLEGVRAPFRVEGLSPLREPVDVVLDSGIPDSVAPQQPPYRLNWLAAGVAYMAIDDMSDVAEFAAFAQDAFSAIHRKKAKGLVVDLRQNGGGSTDVGEMLLDRVTNKPYRICAEKYSRVSSRYRAVLAGSPYVTPDYLAAPIGTNLHYSGPAMRSRHVVRPIFRGPVCVLIGSHTGSSAMMLANAIEDYDLATLIGEPTASPPNYFSEFVSFHLPHTFLEADVATARFVRASGDTDNPNPVMPDIAIRQSVEQWLRNEDPVLRRAREWILKGR